MSATASSRARRLLLPAWAVFAAANVVLMWTLPGAETIPFHFVWISIAVVFGVNTWPVRTMVACLAAIAVVTGAVLVHHASVGVIGYEEITEVPLMAGVFLAMVWHVRGRQQAAAKLRRLAALERKRADNQQVFIRLTSHELRTPITVARGYVELVRDAHPEAQAREDCAIVLDELDRLDRLTARLGMLMQMEGELPVRPVDVDAFVRRTIQRWSPVADRRWVSASTVGELDANEERMRAAVDSLIENAVRFTSDGDAVELHAWRERRHVVMEVRDTGTGIPEADLARVFDRFWSRVPDGAPTGTGLGLAIARAAVEARGGTIMVRSQPGVGTVFTMRVPVRAPAPLAPRGVELVATR